MRCLPRSEPRSAAGPYHAANPIRRRPAYGASTPGSNGASFWLSFWRDRGCSGHGRWPFFDKDTLPLKRLATRRRHPHRPWRLVDPRGAFLGRGVICMPPMFVNIGAYVDEGTMIDSHALVGSCAQIGKRVHSQRRRADWRRARAGRRAAGHHRRRRARRRQLRHLRRHRRPRRAVIAAGVVLTGSTPITDLPNNRMIVPRGRRAPRRSGRRGRGAGHTSDRVGSRSGTGHFGGDASDCEVSRRADQRADGARAMDSVTLVEFARQLIDIESTTGREHAAGEWLVNQLVSLGYRRDQTGR